MSKDSNYPCQNYGTLVRNQLREQVPLTKKIIVTPEKGRTKCNLDSIFSDFLHESVISDKNMYENEALKEIKRYFEAYPDILNEFSNETPFVYLFFGGKLLFGDAALLIASFVSPAHINKARGYSEVLLGRQSLGFHIESQVVDRVLAEYYNEKTHAELVVQITNLLNCNTFRDNVFDSSTQSIIDRISFLKSNTKNRRTREESVNDLTFWNPSLNFELWRGLSDFCAASFKMMRSLEGEQYQIVKKMQQECFDNVLQMKVPYPKIALDEAMTCFRINTQRVTSVEQTVRWQEVVDLGKIPGGKNLLDDPETTLMKSIEPFNRELNPEVEEDRKIILNLLGFEDFKTFATSILVSIFCPESKGDIDLARRLSAEGHKLFILPEDECYMPSGSACPSLGRNHGGQIEAEMQLLKARILANEEGYTMIPLLQGPTAFLESFHETLSIDTLKEQTQAVTSMLLKSARDVHRRELDHVCHPGCNHEEHPIRIAQIIRDQKNNKSRGLLNANAQDVYGRPIPFLRRVAGSYLINYGVAAHYKEGATIAEMSNRLPKKGKAIVGSEDASQSTYLADETVAEALLNAFDICGIEITSDERKAIARNLIPARIYRLNRESFPTMDMTSNRIIKQGIPFDYKNININILLKLSPNHSKVISLAWEAWNRCGSGYPIGLKAGTGTGKTFSLVMISILHAAMHHTHIEIVLDSQQSVNSMFKSITGRNPLFTEGEEHIPYAGIFSSLQNELISHDVLIGDEILGVAHGAIRNYTERTGQVIITTSESLRMRCEKGRIPDIVIVDEVDSNLKSICFLESLNQHEPINLIYTSATLPTGIVRDQDLVSGLENPAPKVAYMSLGVPSIISILSEIDGSGIVMIYQLSVAEVIKLQKALSPQFDVSIFHGLLPAEDRVKALEPPNTGFKVVISTPASLRADLKQVCLVISPSEESENAYIDEGIKVLTRKSITPSTIEQMAARAGRSNHPLALYKGRPLHLILSSRDQSIPRPISVENPYETGLLLGLYNMEGINSPFPFSESQARSFSVGFTHGRNGDKENTRFGRIPFSSVMTKVMVMIISEGLIPSIPKVTFLSLGMTDYDIRILSHGWDSDTEEFMKFIFTCPIDLGTGWEKVRKLIHDSDLGDEDCDIIDWEQVAQACPDFVNYYELGTSVTLGGVIVNSIPHTHLKITISQKETICKPVQLVREISNEGNPNIAGNFLIQMMRQKLYINLAPNPGQRLRNMALEWKDKLKSNLQGQPKMDDFIGEQTRGWSLADLLSVLLLSFIKEIQGRALAMIMDSPKCLNYLRNKPEKPEHWIGGAFMRTAYEALHSSYNVVRFTINPNQTLMSVVYNNPTTNGTGHAVTLSGGDDGLDLICYDEEPYPGEQIWTSGEAFGNFMQNLMIIKGDHEQPFSSYHIDHIKTRSFSSIAQSLNPALNTGYDKRSAIRGLIELESLAKGELLLEMKKRIKPFLDLVVLSLDSYVDTSCLDSIYSGHQGMPWDEFAKLAGPQEESRHKLDRKIFLAQSCEQVPSVVCSEEAYEEYDRFWEENGLLFLYPPSREQITYARGNELFNLVKNFNPVNRFKDDKGEFRHRIPKWVIPHLEKRKIEVFPYECIKVITVDECKKIHDEYIDIEFDE